MKNSVFFLFIFLLLGNKLLAQDKIKQLLQERETLNQSYKESENLATGLFGNRSKEDMQATIKILSDILEKDNELLNEYEHLKANSQAEFTDKYNELIQQVNDLSQKNQELLELTERHKGFSKENHAMLEEIEKNQGLVVALLGISILLVIIYVSKYFALKSKYKKLKENV
jgi:chromosome segregation ATPase